MKFHNMRTRGRLNILLVILPLLCDGLSSAQQSSTELSLVETPLCDDNLRTKYCDAWYGGDLHTGCRHCGVGPQCPSTNPTGRGLKNRPDIKEEILRRHNEYRAVVRSGKSNLPASKCLPELRYDHCLIVL
jgi:hypothetical protein